MTKIKKKYIIKMCMLVISLCVLSGCAQIDVTESVNDDINVTEETVSTVETSDKEEEADNTQSTDAVVQVSNAKELLEAIVPGATIIISPGYYNLSEYTEEIWNTGGEEWNQTHPYVQLRECFDGGIEVVVGAGG